MEEKAEGYLKMIIRNHLASVRGVDPVDISPEEVDTMYKTDSLPGHRLLQVPIVSTINGKKSPAIVCSIQDIETGYEYYSNVVR